MSFIHEQLSERFHAWEKRGRGWQVFDEPVYPEPPFVPFPGHYEAVTEIADDGRRPTLLSSLISRLSKKPPPPPPPPEPEPEPDTLYRDKLVELTTSLPAKLDIPKEAFEQFLLNLSLCREPIAFELLGVHNRIIVQFAASESDAPLVRRQLQAHFPEAMFQAREGGLETAWDACEGNEALAVEFGLEREFMYPLQSGKLDPFIGLIAALSELKLGELGLFQVIFQPVRHPWQESIIRSVSHADGKPFFVNEPELTAAAKNKIDRPLFVAVVRIAVRSESFDRSLEIARDMAGSLTVFGHPQGNQLIPLQNTGYLFEEHIEDVLLRQSRRSGMLLNTDELIGFVHLPGSAVRSAVLERDAGKTRAAPGNVRGQGILLGNNVHAGETVPVCLAPDQRVKHCHIIGVHGTGKSTLLFNLIKQDIENGEGVAVLDPHGDLIEQILGIIPEDRITDVVLVDPSDEGYSVGFNILSAHSDLEKNLLASDLVSIFQRLSSSWGDQLNSVLQNAILAFLESSEGGTLADVQRFLLEPAFREKFLSTVRDPSVVYYWKKGFTQLSGNKSIGPVLTRLGTFLSPKPIRYMVSQKENRLDFAEIIDTGKIFLAKLPQGQIGRENSFLLGSLLVSKFQQLAMSRQAQKVSARKDFWLYIDEFAYFITPSMTEILTGARKYRLGLILAHQELRQLERDREVASAVLSNPYTRVVFRVGDADARSLESGFSFFEARDLQNLDTGQAICRVEKADGDFNLSVPFLEAVDPAVAAATRQAVVAASRARYAIPRAEVEAMLRSTLTETTPEPPKPKAVSPPLKIAEPPPAEVPTVSEKEKVIIPQPESKPVAPETQPKPRQEERGIGGHQHNLIRERIEAMARELGFHAHREKPTGDGRKMDVALERDGQVIACEISILTPVDYEVGNADKCIKAGCHHVAMICPEPAKLAKIQKAISGCLPAEALARIGYYSPDQFLEYLKALKRPEKSAGEPEEKTLGKYKVKRRAANLTPEEIQAREAAAHRVLAERMRRKPKP